MTLPEALPLVSVIMPIRNEQAFIAQSLGAVLSQDYPANFLEILVADGMSDDNTRAVIAGLPHAERVKIIQNPRRRQAAGLNVVLKVAQGEIVVRVDGHTVIAPDYVRQCVLALQRTGAANVGGAMDTVGVTPMGLAIAAASKSPFAVPSAFHVSKTEQYTDTVYLGAWPRHILVELGGFSEGVGVNEDYELNYRIRAIGGKILLSPAICSRYYGRQTLGALARQYFVYGRSKVLTLRRHPGSLRLRQLAAPVFVLGLLGGLILSPFINVIRVLWVTLVLTYVMLGVVFSLRVIRRVRVSVWRLPLVFTTIHVAWGLGFLSALVRKGFS